MPITYGPPDKKKVIAGTGIAAGTSTVQGVGKASIYEATASATSDVTVQLAIKGLQPVFEKMDDPVLYVMAHDKEDVGSRIGGVENVPETTLKALAGYEWEKRKGHKRDRKWIIGLVVIFLLAVAGWIA